VKILKDTLFSLAHQIRDDKVLGSLDRIEAWLRVGGYVNTAPNFVDYPRVMNAASRLITEIFGEASGSHARLAIGVAGLPWGVPVEMEAELSLAG